MEKYFCAPVKVLILASYTYPVSYLKTRRLGDNMAGYQTIIGTTGPRKMKNNFGFVLTKFIVGLLACFTSILLGKIISAKQEVLSVHISVAQLEDCQQLKLLRDWRVWAAKQAKTSKSDRRSRNDTVGLEIETSGLEFETSGLEIETYGLEIYTKVSNSDRRSRN